MSVINVISQGSAATQLRCGGQYVPITLLQISW